ncbi:MAG TPA: hypothetical protein VFZ23_13890 [Pyrinomonadaceae bacterium]
MKNLRALVFLFLASAFVPGVVDAQDKADYFDVPLKYVNFLLLNDENSPLQLSDGVVLATEKGHLNYFYTISNFSNSAVKSFKIEEFDAFVNPSYAASPNGTANDELSFVAYESFSTLDEAKKSRMKIVHLDEEGAKKFKLSEEQKRVWIVLVTKVELYDGTTYDATARFRAIKEFVDQIKHSEYELEDDAPRIPFSEKEGRLHEFIANIMKKDTPR